MSTENPATPVPVMIPVEQLIPATPNISPAGSMKGYKFRIWWNKNKETIKIMLSAGVGLAMMFLPNIPSVQASIVTGGVSTAVSKLVFDTLDFWITPVNLEVTK